MVYTGYMRRKELAERTGIHPETLRFYERKGLIPSPPRLPSGYRDYPPETIDRILFIKRAKELGFSLGEIKELLSLNDNPPPNCEEVREKVRAKIVLLEEKIRDLRKIKEGLADLLKSCDTRKRMDSCPILDILSGKEGGEKE